MVTTVSLQPPFEYYWWVDLIAVLLATACIAVLVYVIRKLLKIEGLIKGKNPAIHVPPPKKLYEIKNDYIDQMERLAAT